MDVQYMRVAVGEAGIDVVVDAAGGELDLEVSLVLDGVAALRRIGVVVLYFVVAVEVIVEGVVDDGEIIRRVVRLDDLTLDVQRVRAGTRRLVDQDSVAELRSSGQVYSRSNSPDCTHWPPRTIPAVVTDTLT